MVGLVPDEAATIESVRWIGQQARLSTKLAAALLEAGWSWSQIEADAGLSDRTIRRAKREIDLGPPAQVGQALTRAQIFSLSYT